MCTNRSVLENRIAIAIIAVAVAAMAHSCMSDQYPADQYNCRADMECEYEDYIRMHKGYCIVVDDKFLCTMPIDTN